jgi:hypothetical protein
MAYKKLTNEEKEARKQARREAREKAKTEARINAEKNQKPVKHMTITIEWSKSRTWGMNPHAEARIEHVDGSWSYLTGYTASGCGYDKESTVIAQIFNDTLKYKLWNIETDKLKRDSGAPYGITMYSPDNRSFSGGIGTSCYYDISEFIGGKFKNTANGKTFGVFEYTDN